MHPLVSEQIARLTYDERLREAASYRRTAGAPRRPAPWRVQAGHALERLGARVAGSTDTVPTPARPC